MRRWTSLVSPIVHLSKFRSVDWVTTSDHCLNAACFATSCCVSEAGNSTHIKPFLLVWDHQWQELQKSIVCIRDTLWIWSCLTADHININYQCYDYYYLYQLTATRNLELLLSILYMCWCEFKCQCSMWSCWLTFHCGHDAVVCFEFLYVLWINILLWKAEWQLC